MSLPEPVSSPARRAKLRVSEPPNVVNIPVNSLIDDTDPTRDIRALIDQLQRTANEARTQVHAAEVEKENIAEQLETALAELHTARSREAELRSRFVEVTAVIKERDAAVAAGERYVKTIAELQKRVDAHKREQEAGDRQREGAVRQAESLNRSLHAVSAELEQAQKQVVSIRQARDAAQAQAHELVDKLAAAEDEIAELGYARDAAQKGGKQATEEVTQLRRQIEKITQARDTLAAQIAELTREVDEHRSKLLDIAEEKSAVSQADSEHAAALTEVRQQVSNLTAERDHARGQVEQRLAEIETLRAQVESLVAEQSAAQEPSSEIQELARQIEILTAERDARAAKEHEHLEEIVAQEERLAALATQLSATQRGREEALTSVAAAQKQIEYIIRDRDAVRSQNTEALVALEAQIAEARSRNAELSNSLAVALREREEALALEEKSRSMAHRYEQQRLQAIDLGSRLEAAKREIIELTASLAEARLQFKAAANTVKAAPAPAKAAPAPRIHARLARHAKIEVASHGEVSAPFSDKESRNAVTAMRRCYQTFVKHPEDLSLLNELYSHAQSFAVRAGDTGLVALHRLSESFSSLANYLYRTPDFLNPSAMRTMHQAIDCLTAATKDRHLMLTDPARATVYAINDKLDEGDAVAMALETVMIRTTCAQDPILALAELASERFDLIFLDANLTAMDPLTLCADIRELPTCAATPIVFIMDPTTPDGQLDWTLGNDFIARPLNLHELTVKTFTSVLKAQLGLA